MFFKPILLVFSVFISFLFVFGQNENEGEENKNLVPNPGFEVFSIMPHGWFYRGADFTSLVKDWSSASEASPDVYGPNITVPDTWQEKGFGRKKPRSGSYMAGITAFGCNQGKPHCREYIQVNLTEPLVPGQAYHVEFWASPLHTGIHSNNLGILFSMQKLQEKTDRVVIKNPQIYSEKIVPGNEYIWHKIQGDITADKAYKFLILGNFFPDEETLSSEGSENSHNFAYYYIDDVMVYKRPPIIDETKDEFADWYPLEEDKIIPLDNILFDTDKAIIRTKGKSDLDRLYKILVEYPTMEIEVGGHTDNQGGFDYNMKLSNRRAKAVVSYLINKGIDEQRLSYIGYGTTRHIATNDTEEGRQQNRRVEFRIRTI
ncbi:MAG: OmpA family protein [Saprospiraceae bacterium]|nr:OmpA family protein [Saprospiraceae bacterium]